MNIRTKKLSTGIYALQRRHHLFFWRDIQHGTEWEMNRFFRLNIKISN